MRRIAFLILKAGGRLWLYLRWLILKVLSLALRVLPRRYGRDLLIIRIGNMLFRRMFGDEIFLGFESYVRLVRPEIEPYLALLPARDWLDEKSVLEIGSGLGHYSDALSKLGATRVVALEYQPEKAEFARRFHRNEPGPAFHAMAASADRLPFPPSAFDTVFSHTVFEHLPDVPGALAEIKRVVRPGGKILLSFNFIHNEGGHHLFPYIHFPWAPWVVDETSLCRYWSERLAADQSQGRGGYYPRGCRIADLSQGNEIHLNKLDFEQFESMVRDSGLSLVKALCTDPVGRIFPAVRRLPKLRYFLTGTIYYVLERPA